MGSCTDKINDKDDGGGMIISKYAIKKLLKEMIFINLMKEIIMKGIILKNLILKIMIGEIMPRKKLIIGKI